MSLANKDVKTWLPVRHSLVDLSHAFMRFAGDFVYEIILK